MTSSSRNNPPAPFPTAAVLLIAAAALAAQPQSKPAPEFEAASVKVAPPPDGRGMSVGMTGGPGSSDPGRIRIMNESLKGLVETAYRMSYWEVSGPDWTDGQKFNIDATLAPGTTKEQLGLMLQKLLADRFQLVVHRETKEVPLYRLVVAKSGSKLQPAAPGQPSKDEPEANGPLKRDKDGYPILRKGMGVAMVAGNSGGRARAQGHKEPIGSIVSLLSGQLACPVLDTTGLTGEYDYVLSWIPSHPGSGPGEAASDAGPDLFQAIQEQFGLKLERGKGPIEVLVIDSAARTPREN